MTDSEVNEAVALKLEDKPVLPDQYTEDGKLVRCYRDYCHSIEAAWEIVDKNRTVTDGGRHYVFEVTANDRIFSAAWHDNAGNLAWEIADTAPMAICLAFLKLP